MVHPKSPHRCWSLRVSATPRLCVLIPATSRWIRRPRTTGIGWHRAAACELPRKLTSHPQLAVVLCPRLGRLRTPCQTAGDSVRQGGVCLADFGPAFAWQPSAGCRCRQLPFRAGWRWWRRCGPVRYRAAGCRTARCGALCIVQTSEVMSLSRHGTARMVNVFKAMGSVSGRRLAYW